MPAEDWVSPKPEMRFTGLGRSHSLNTVVLTVINPNYNIRFFAEIILMSIFVIAELHQELIQYTSKSITDSIIMYLIIMYPSMFSTLIIWGCSLDERRGLKWWYSVVKGHIAAVLKYISNADTDLSVPCLIYYLGSIPGLKWWRTYVYSWLAFTRGIDNLFSSTTTGLKYID